MATQDEAVRLYSRVFTNLIERQGEISSFRQLITQGFPAAMLKLSAENYRLAKDIENGAYSKIFSDPKAAVAFLGGIKEVAQGFTARRVNGFWRVVDGASLEFMHAAVDAALSDLCRVTLLLAPTRWEKYVERRTVTFEELRAQDAQSLLAGRLDTYVRGLDREPLLARADRLFEICQPPKGFAPVGNYQYDRERLEQLDKLRQAIVHGGEPVPPPVPECENTVEYLARTGLFFCAMVHEALGVQIDPAYAWGIDLSQLPAGGENPPQSPTAA